MQRLSEFGLFRSGLSLSRLGDPVTKKRCLIAAGCASASAAFAYAVSDRALHANAVASARSWMRPLPLVHAESSESSSRDSAKAGNIELVPAWRTLKTRTVKGVHELPFDLTLLQYETCPYCSKVCAFLDYYGIAYNLVEVNPLFRDELKLVTDKYRKVPLMIVSDKSNPSNFIFVPESALIISALKSLLSGFVPPPPVSSFTSSSASSKPAADSASSPVDIVSEVLKFYPPFMIHEEQKKTSWFGKKVKQSTDYRNKYYIMYGEDHMYSSAQMAAAYREEVLWRSWVDDKFLHSLSPNIYRTLLESVHTFRYLSEEGHWEDLFPAWKREFVVYVGAAVMWIVGKRVAKRHELSSDPRYSMYEYANVWLKAVGKDRQFMGGAQPNLADLAVYGVLSAIEGTDAFRDLCRETKMGEWYFNTKKFALSHAGAADAVQWQNNLKKINAGRVPPTSSSNKSVQNPAPQNLTAKDRKSDMNLATGGQSSTDVPIKKRGYFFT